MGMFDYVIVECPIDGIAHAETVEWQTKSFDEPFGRRYKITVDGRLFEELVHFEDRSDPNADGLARFLGCMTPVHDAWRDTNYHGDIHLCAARGKFVEVTARFTNGKLERIACDAS